MDVFDYNVFHNPLIVLWSNTLDHLQQDRETAAQKLSVEMHLKCMCCFHKK